MRQCWIEPDWKRFKMSGPFTVNSISSRYIYMCTTSTHVCYFESWLLQRFTNQMLQPDFSLELAVEIIFLLHYILPSVWNLNIWNISPLHCFRLRLLHWATLRSLSDCIPSFHFINFVPFFPSFLWSSSQPPSLFLQVSLLSGVFPLHHRWVLAQRGFVGS